MSSSDPRLQYSEAGQGETVLLLDWTPWQSTVLLHGLAQGYRVINVEPPDVPAEQGTADDAARAVAAVTAAAGLDSFAIVGASLGAEAALRLALLDPGRVAALVLVSPLGGKSASAEKLETPELAAAAMLAHPEVESPEPPEPERTATLARLAREWASAESEYESSLADLHCATLVVYGQEDRLVSRTAGHAWKERAPNCSVSYVYDAGHAIAVDRPDALLNVVLDFVTRRETFIVENRSSLINP